MATVTAEPRSGRRNPIPAALERDALLGQPDFLSLHDNSTVPG
jgi:hypothetical protein